MSVALRLLAALLFMLGLMALFVFVVSFAGHPPNTGFGIAILPITLVSGLALIYGAIKVMLIGTKDEAQ
jgi:hypothetical protein